MSLYTDSSIKEEEEEIEHDSETEQMIQDALKECYDWFEADRTAKDFYMEEMEELYKLYKGDHWSMKGEDGRVLRTPSQKRSRPNAVENVTFALVEGFVSEFSQDIEIVDYPVEKGDEDVASVMSDLKKFIAYKNRVKMEMEKWLRFFFLYGTGIWHPYWDPTWKGGKGPNRWRGEVRWKALHPQVLYPDARCRDSIEDGRRVHKAIWRTLEYIRENFPKRGSEVMPDDIRYDMLVGDEEPIETMEAGEEQALIVETWYKGSPMILGEGEEDQGPGLHVIWWAGEGNKVYLKHSNYVYFDPGEDYSFPFILRNCYPRENSIWGFGEAHFLKSPQIVRNKTGEIIIEAHMHHAMGQTLYNESALTPKQQKQIKEQGTLPGMWFPVKDISGIRRETPGSGVANTLPGEMGRLQTMMETLVGRFDISQGRTPGSVTAFRALDLLASRAQVRLRSKEQSQVTAYEDVGNYTNNLITKNYTHKRAFRILGEDDSETVYHIFEPEEHLKVYLFEYDEVYRYKDFAASGIAGMTDEHGEPRMVEGEHYEIYSPEFDTKCKTTTSLPTDRVFYMEMAKELLMNQIIDEEIFWYVIEKGKFPPFEDIAQRSGQAGMQGEMPQAEGSVPPGGQQGGAPQGGDAPPDFATVIQAAMEQRPELAQKFNSLPPEEQERVVNQMMAEMGGGGSAPGGGQF